MISKDQLIKDTLMFVQLVNIRNDMREVQKIIENGKFDSLLDRFQRGKLNVDKLKNEIKDKVINLQKDIQNTLDNVKNSYKTESEK